MEKCSTCGKELTALGTTKCLDCSRETVRKIFRENPEVKQAFHESVQEMQKPENRKKMVDDTCKFMSALQSLRK